MAAGTWGAPFLGNFLISTCLGVGFLPWGEILGNTKFFEFEPRLDSAPSAFLNRTP